MGAVCQDHWFVTANLPQRRNDVGYVAITCYSFARIPIVQCFFSTVLTTAELLLNHLPFCKVIRSLFLLLTIQELINALIPPHSFETSVVTNSQKGSEKANYFFDIFKVWAHICHTFVFFYCCVFTSCIYLPCALTRCQSHLEMSSSCRCHL